LEIPVAWKKMAIMKLLESIILANCPPLEPVSTGLEPRLTKLDGVKAVLLDVYGTLFISGSGDVGTAASMDAAAELTQTLAVSGFEGNLKQAGLKGEEMLKAEIPAWHKRARKNGVDFPEVDIIEIWKKILGTLFDSPVASDQIRKLAMEYECRTNPVYPMPGSSRILADLKKKGVILGIVSNAQFYTPLLFSAFFRKTVEECGFDPDCCIWSFEERKAKPSTDLFFKADRLLRRKYSIAPEETVYVGNDMLNDIYCAQTAGCRTVLFAGDKRSLRLRENDERCLAIQPDAVITSLAQLSGIV
jgi:putative hydrolase of the HAD superfamily